MGKPLTLVDDHLLQLPLGRSPLQDLLVDGVGCDQAVHHHWFGLPDAMTAVLSLQVCLGVLGRGHTTHVRGMCRTVTFEKQAHRPLLLIGTYPVAVEDDDSISRCQVDPKSSGSGAQQEQEHLGILGKLGHLGEKKNRMMQ